MRLKEEDPCWDDYEMVGMKKKNGKEVPNCVPKSEATDAEEQEFHSKLDKLVHKTFGKRPEEEMHEELRPDEVEFIIKKLGNSMPNHTDYDYDKGPTDKQVLKALKKYHSDFFRHSTTKQKKEIVKGIQKYTTESIDEDTKGMSKQELDRAARGMFGKSYSRLTMDQEARLKYYLSQSKNEAVKIKMNNLDWGKSTAERNANLDKYDLLKTDKEREAFLRKLKGESVNEQADHVAPMVAKAYKDYIKAKKDSAADVDFAKDPEKAYRYYSKKLNNTYSTRFDRDAIEAILKKKYGSAMEESVNESASRTAMEIGGLTGLNKDAIQKFVDDNKLDIEKVYQFVKKGKLADRMKLVSAIAGKPNNPVQKKMVKQFGEGLIKEAKVRLGNDSVNFKVLGDSKGLTFIAATGNDLDGLQDAIENDVDVKDELRKTLEKQLKIPVEVDRGYEGAGFRFNIDFYSLAKKVK